MTMKRILAISVCGVLAILAAGVVTGDTLVTTGGSEYKGTIVVDGETYILTLPNGGKVKFLKRMVSKVLKDAEVTPPKPVPPKPLRPDSPPPTTTENPVNPPTTMQTPPPPVIALTPMPKSVRRPEVKRVVFASEFENATDQEQYDPAAAALGDMVAVMLAYQDGIDCVERQRLVALTAEQARSLQGLTGDTHALGAGKLVWADTVLVGRLFLIKDKMTVSVRAIDIATERVVASEQVSCRPAYLVEASLQIARKLAEQMKLPLPEIDLKKIDKSPIASLHFAQALAHYYGGNMDAAIMQFMRTMDLDPDYTEAHFWSAMAYHRLGEWPHAAIEWRKFLARKPNLIQAKTARTLLAEAELRVKDTNVQRLGPDTKTTDK